MGEPGLDRSRVLGEAEAATSGRLGGWQGLLLVVLLASGCRDLSLGLDSQGSDQGTLGTGGTTSTLGTAGEAGANFAEEQPQASELVALEPGPVNLQEDSEAVIELDGYDTEGLLNAFALSAQVSELPEHGTLSPQAGNLPLRVRYTPNADFSGDDSLVFEVTDGNDLRSPPRTVSITVEPVNDAPVARDDLEHTSTLTPVEVAVIANDHDVDDAAADLSVSLSPLETLGGEFELLAGNLVRYTPAHPNTGTARVEYTLRDVAGAEATATLSVEVELGATVRIESFEASPSQVALGGDVTLSWHATNATSCSLEGADIEGNTSGSVVVAPQGTSSFTLTCLGPGGRVQAITEVQVSGGDSDGDGLSDDVEESLGTRPDDADTDDDGVPDGVEIDSGTDPWLPDSNEDGYCDGLRADGDGDGLDPESDCVGPILVDASNPNTFQDGRSWPTAYGSVQQGVDEASAGQEVWVAEGRYVASARQLPVLELPPQLAIYGGFAGGESYRRARDQSSRATILDGDFLGDDETDLTLNRSDNSQHVVRMTGSGRLDGFLIRNGQQSSSSSVGAGAKVEADAVLANVDFLRNVGTGNGGAVACVDGCGLRIENAVFADNHAGHGGALYGTTNLASGSRIELQTVEFQNNGSSNRGGAIYTLSRVAIAAEAVKFSGNRAVYGGGLYTSGGVTLSNVSFMGNHVTGSGGGIYNTGSLLAEGTTFADNTAEFGGGVENSTGSRGTLVDCDFDGNRASKEGGAVHSYFAEVDIIDSTFTSNEAESFAGAVLHWGNRLSVSSVSFSMNTAGKQAGAMRVYKATSEITDSEFSFNGAASQAGALQVWWNATRIDNTTFRRNTAFNDADPTNGGALDCYGADCELTGVSFLENEASYGASIFAHPSCEENDCVEPTLSLSDAWFSSNAAGVTAGGIYQDAGTASLERVLFFENYASFGGAVAGFHGAALSAQSAAFVDNTGSAFGGALYLEATAGFRHSAFIENTAADGGAVALRAGSIADFAGVSWRGNLASDRGGGVFLDAGSEPRLTSVSFLDNQATRGGALAAVEQSHATLTNASLLNNSAAVAGGGIYNSMDSAMTLRNSIFFGNAVGSQPSDMSDQGNASIVEFVRSQQTFGGTSNASLSVDPFDRDRDSLFLRQDLSAEASGVDAGSDALADDATHGFAALGLPGWATLTTSRDASLDAGTVDLGRHTATDTVAISEFVAGASELVWQTRHAKACFLLRRPTDDPVPLVLSASGTRTHSWSSNSPLTLVCFGDAGEPAVARTSVP